MQVPGWVWLGLCHFSGALPSLALASGWVGCTAGAARGTWHRDAFLSHRPFCARVLAKPVRAPHLPRHGSKSFPGRWVSGPSPGCARFQWPCREDCVRGAHAKSPAGSSLSSCCPHPQGSGDPGAREGGSRAVALREPSDSRPQTMALWLHLLLSARGPRPTAHRWLEEGGAGAAAGRSQGPGSKAARPQAPDPLASPTQASRPQ